MSNHALGRHMTAALFLVSISLTACEEPREGPFAPQLGVEADRSPPQREPLDIYTQNVYLGGDTGPLFSLDFSDLPAVITAANVFWGQVQGSLVAERMAAIVDEIETRRPHVVGLQEVFQFALLDGSFQPVGGLDLLGSLQGEIAARGLPYVTEVVQPATSSALPLAVDPAVGVTRYLAFTDRLVVLRRADVDVVLSNHGTYHASVPLGPLEIERAWARVSFKHGGVPYHFVTTHLETQALAAVQAEQARELLAIADTGLEGVTIISGDLNSDAAAGPGDPSWTPTYGQIRDAGYADLWELAPASRRQTGFTCCHASDLRNGAVDLDERIDFVLVRSSESSIPGHGERRGTYRAVVVGAQLGDRTPNGLWPSDHAGIVASISPPAPPPSKQRVLVEEAPN